MSHSNLRREDKLRQFDAAARATSEEIAKTGLSDENLEEQFENARKQMHRINASKVKIDSDKPK